MKKVVSILVGIVVVAGIVAAVYFGMFAPKNFETASVSKEDIQEVVSGSGNLESNRIEDISCEDAIEIQDIFVKAGDRVKEDEILFTYKKVKVSNNGKTAVEEEILEMKAEFAGVVTQLFAEKNMTIPADTMLMKIADTEDVYAAVAISQNEIENVSKGQHATITINDNEYNGEVSRINYLAVEDSGKPKITVEVQVEDADDMLILGEEVDIDIYTRFKENVISVPVEAVYSDTDNDFVYIIDNGMVSRELITTGISSEDFTEVEEGLAEGELVITGEVADSDRGKRAVSR